MSGYRGRAGPNFSEFLNNLNTVSPPYDQDQFTGDDTNLEEDLAMFTNADFTHFDIPQLADNASLGFELDNEAKADENIQYEDLLADPVPFFSNYNSVLQPAPQTLDTHFGSKSIPTPSNTLPSSNVQQLGLAAKPQAPLNTTNINNNNNNNKHQKIVDVSTPTSSTITATASPSQVPVEEQARLAAEEDKRRRNTAASARFRVKKKQREQALEHTVKDMNDRNATLESKVNQLEMENKWLKNLITEKNGTGLQSKKDFAEAYKRWRRESEERETKRIKGENQTETTPSSSSSSSSS